MFGKAVFAIPSVPKFLCCRQIQDCRFIHIAQIFKAELQLNALLFECLQHRLCVYDISEFIFALLCKHWCFCCCCRRATLLSARQGMMSARGDFLNYALSLMRSHNDEHSDVLPVLDVCSLKHVAYVFQALIYWIKAMNQQTTLDTPQLERKRYVYL